MQNAREQIRETLLEAHERHHQRRRAKRRAVRGGGAVAFVLIAAIGAWRVLSPAPVSTQNEMIANAPPSPVVESVIQIVHTPTGILDRYAASSAHARIQIVDDTALLDTLQDFGHRSGLIRQGRDVRFTTEIPVTNPAPPIENPRIN